MIIMRIYLDNSNIFANFGAWIGGSCKPSDKGKLTAFPRFKNCQQNFNIVSSMLRFEDLPEINSPRWLSLDNFEGEIWKPVEGREKKLSISNYGRVKRNEYKLFYKGRWNNYKEKIYRQHTLKWGHQVISAMTCDKVETLTVHRLVAKAFIPNPDNLPFINHKDENPRNNMVSNIEWCTALYNSNYGGCRGKIKLSKVYNGLANSVVLYDLNDNVIKVYNTEHDVQRELGVSRCAVNSCCKGIYATACGLYLRYNNAPYKKDLSNENLYYIENNGEKVLLSSFTKDGIEELLNSIDSKNLYDSIFFNTRKCVGVDKFELLQINGIPFLRFMKGRKMVYIYLKT